MKLVGGKKVNALRTPRRPELDLAHPPDNRHFAAVYNGRDAKGGGEYAAGSSQTSTITKNTGVDTT